MEQVANPVKELNSSYSPQIRLKAIWGHNPDCSSLSLSYVHKVFRGNLFIHLVIDTNFFLYSQSFQRLLIYSFVYWCKKHEYIFSRCFFVCQCFFNKHPLLCSCWMFSVGLTLRSMVWKINFVFLVSNDEAKLVICLWWLIIITVLNSDNSILSSTLSHVV